MTPITFNLLPNLITPYLFSFSDLVDHIHKYPKLYKMFGIDTSEKHTIIGTQHTTDVTFDFLPTSTTFTIRYTYQPTYKKHTFHSAWQG